MGRISSFRFSGEEPARFQGRGYSGSRFFHLLRALTYRVRYTSFAARTGLTGCRRVVEGRGVLHAKGGHRASSGIGYQLYRLRSPYGVSVDVQYDRARSSFLLGRDRGRVRSIGVDSRHYPPQGPRVALTRGYLSFGRGQPNSFREAHRGEAQHVLQSTVRRVFQQVLRLLGAYVARFGGAGLVHESGAVLRHARSAVEDVPITFGVGRHVRRVFRGSQAYRVSFFHRVACGGGKRPRPLYSLRGSVNEFSRLESASQYQACVFIGRDLGKISRGRVQFSTLSRLACRFRIHLAWGLRLVHGLPSAVDSRLGLSREFLT